jgi:hypothetical protein
MQKTLESRSDLDARGILAQAALSLQPHPWEFVPTEAVTEVLTAAREALRIPATDNSDTSVARLREYFRALLSDRLLPPNDRTAVRDRLGTRGLLSPKQYDIERNPALTARGGIYRAKWSHIEDAIQNADEIEHFRSVDGMSDAPLVSLFMRRPPAAYQFWWLIHCTRAGAKLFPFHAWRLFDDTFSRAEIETPRRAIVSFANRFGMDMVIHGATMKIAFREAVRNPSPGERVGLVQTSGLRFEGAGNLPELLVGFSYMIDNAKYSSYLAAHGISG